MLKRELLKRDNIHATQVCGIVLPTYVSVCLMPFGFANHGKKEGGTGALTKYLRLVETSAPESGNEAT